MNQTRTFADVEEDEDELEENELVLILCVLVTSYCRQVEPCHDVRSRAHLLYTRILAAASIRERRLFCSACLEVRLQFESGV